MSANIFLIIYRLLKLRHKPQ